MPISALDDHRVDYLRIFDTHGVPIGTPIALTLNYYDLGADPRAKAGGDDFIQLPGAGIAPLHARLQRDRQSGQWFLTPLTDAGTRIGSDAPMARNTKRAIESGRDIWMGHIHAQIILDDPNTSSAGGPPELSRLEQRLSLSLLDYEERNRSLFTDVTDARRAHLLDSQLNELIDAELKRVNTETLHHFTREAMRRLMVLSCLKSGEKGDVEPLYSRMTVDQIERSVLFRASYLGKLGLSMDPNQTEHDIKLIQDSIEAVHAELSATIDSAMKRAFVADAIRETTLSLIFDLGPIQFFLNTQGINEIMVNGHEQIFIEKAGKNH